MARVRRIATIGLATSLVGLVSLLEFRLGSPPVETVDVLSEIRGREVSELYQRWAGQQDAAGGDSNIMVSLGRARNHAVEAQRGAAGSSKIDMKTGEITAQISGLADTTDYDLWLVDNAGNTGDSALPDAGDHMVKIGAFTRDGDTASVTGKVDVALFDRFQIDMVVVSRKGEQPDKGGVLFGSMSLFQRIYSALGSEKRLLASDFAGSARRTAAGETSDAMLSVRSAHAAQNVFIDADVVFSALVRRGSDLFFNGTFAGNGRTCGTCHPPLNNTTIDVQFIDDLPDDDPLFVAEFIPALAQNFENPRLMRGAALIKENLDGFDDLARKFVMRSVPHTLGLSQTITPTNIPFDNTAPPNSNFAPGFPAARTGWGGDGAPNSGSLRDFATGAVTQHFPLTLARVNGRDFRLPTATELDAMEAFQLALGRKTEVDLNALKLRDVRARLGRDLFNRLDTGNPPKPQLSPAPNPAPQGPPLPAGKCVLCHQNAGANLNTAAFLQLFASIGQPVPNILGNANFATGVNDLHALPADLIDRAGNTRDGGFGIIPHDNRTNLPQNGNRPCLGGRGGFGVVTLPGGFLPPGLCEEDFNTVSLHEAADTPPFFHNNAVNTIEAAVVFYNSDALNNAVGGILLKTLDTNGIGIKLDTSEVTAIASLLRVLNALENIRQARETLNGAISAVGRFGDADIITLLDNSAAEVEDAAKVLADGQLHPAAVTRLRQAVRIINTAIFVSELNTALTRLTQAQRELVDP